MKKIAYIIPGFRESSLKQSGYKKIAEYLQVKNIESIQVEIDWKYQSPARFKDFLAQFLKQYKKPKPDTEVYLVGFSFGAVTAFLAEAKIKPKAMILCSLSPYFEEDLQKMRLSWKKWFGKNMTESTYSFDELAPTVSAKTHLIVGDQEYIECTRRARDARKKIKNSKLFIARGARHNVSQKEYLAAVKRAILALE